jgi:hypothetical protein
VKKADDEAAAAGGKSKTQVPFDRYRGDTADRLDSLTTLSLVARRKLASKLYNAASEARGADCWHLLARGADPNILFRCKRLLPFHMC